MHEVDPNRLDDLRVAHTKYRNKRRNMRSNGKNRKLILSKDMYIRYRYAVEDLNIRLLTPLAPRLPGDVGRLVERVVSSILVSPQNRGLNFGGRFKTGVIKSGVNKTKLKMVEPDFAPMVNDAGHIVFAIHPDKLKLGDSLSYWRKILEDEWHPLLVADSKYFGVWDGVLKNVAITDQIKGMIELASYSQSKTFVFVVREGQKLSKKILDFSETLGVNITILTHPF